ncbi:MAG: ATP-dependent helicase C-terminal domain-containing protein [Candidatus Latescibacterota bacterium]
MSAGSAMLPIYEVRDDLLGHLTQGSRAVLTAPTGSGKTTQVPQILLGSGVVAGQIVVLQPRRLATRLVARRVAQEVGCPLGERVGYQTRSDSQVSAATRIRFVTEGLFLRLLQGNPGLEGIGAVILDEFHERTLAADTALALLRRLQGSARPDLRLLVMSATLEAHQVAAALDCPAVEAHVRPFPVQVRYWPGNRQAPVWERAAQAVRALLAQEPEGDVLVFMPGAYEIRRTLEAAQEAVRPGGEPVEFLPLHGGLGAAQQDRAVAPGPQRKVIVATNVAETSITIEGVRHVVDAGLARVHRHDPRRGIDVLLVEPVSRPSTEQRAGRAGRLGPGTCVRLWPESEQQARAPREVPEIRRLDLAEAVLQLAFLGVEDPLAVPWLDPPEPAAVGRAVRLLADLGALAWPESGSPASPASGVALPPAAAQGGEARDRPPALRLTPVGHTMARLPAHPRLSRLLLEAHAHGCLGRALYWAALIGERDLLAQPPDSRYSRIPDAAYPSDLSVREEAFLEAARRRFDPGACSRLGIHASAARQVEDSARALRQACRQLGLDLRQRGEDRDLIRALLVAYFDRVALRRGADTLHCAMAGQRRVELDGRSVARQAPCLLAVEVREVEAGPDRVRTVLSLASAMEVSWLEEVHPERIELRSEVAWNAQAQAVEGFDLGFYDGLVYWRQPAPRVDPAAAEAILVERLQAGEVALERWDRSVEQWLARVRFVAGLFPERGLPTYDGEDLRVVLHRIVAGATRFSHVRRRPCLPAVQGALSARDRGFVEEMAPERVPLPAGTRMRIEYSTDGPPRGRARIQDLYGLEQTPRIAGGRHPLLLEILAPNQRPVQVTDDLAGFWRNTYPQVRPQLQRRYPHHPWR